MTRLDDVLEAPSLRDQVVRRLRAAIVYGEIAAGEVHSAPALAARLGVSITPVREALVELTARGMVTQVRNRGFRVVERSPADLDGVLEVREMLEVPLLRRLASTFEEPDGERLQRLVDDGLAAARAGNFSGFLELDRRFHLGLLELSGNATAVQLLDQVLDQLRLGTFGGLLGAPELTDVAEGHRDILDAVRRRDPDAVERAVHAHLDLTRRVWAP